MTDRIGPWRELTGRENVMPRIDHSEALTAWECYGPCLRITCPTCKAKPYAECRRSDGKRVNLSRTHSTAHIARRKAYATKDQ